MKKLLSFVTLFCFSLILCAQDFTMSGGYSCALSPSLTIDNKLKFIEQIGDEIPTFNIYNHNFEKEKTINVVDRGTIKSGSIYKRRAQERKVDLYDQREYFKGLWSEVFEDAKADLESYDETTDENGNKMYVVSWWDEGYPERYYIIKNDSLYEHYKYYQTVTAYTGEWEVEDDTYEIAAAEVARFGYYDYDANVIFPDYPTNIKLSQNIFNDDEKYEYIVSKYKTTEEEIEERDRDGDGIIDYIRIYTSYEDTGIDVVSEDGKVLFSIDEEVDKEDLNVIKFDNMLYLMVTTYFYNEAEGREEYGQVIYKYNPATTTVEKMPAVIPFKMLSNVVKKNTLVDVEIDGEKVKNGGEIMVFAANGKRVYSCEVAPATTTVQIPTHNMPSGMYVVTFACDGQSYEAAKLIVK